MIGRTISRGIVSQELLSQESFHRNYFHKNSHTLKHQKITRDIVSISQKKPCQTPDTGQPIHHFIVQTLPFPHPKVSAYLTLQDTLTNPQNHLLKTLSRQPLKQACKPNGLLHLRKHRPTSHLVYPPSKNYKTPGRQKPLGGQSAIKTHSLKNILGKLDHQKSIRLTGY